MKFLKKHLVTILLVLVFIIGLCLLLYPTVSDYWNSFHQSRAIASYAETVANLDDDTYEQMLAEAQAYNEALAARGTHWSLSDEELQEYNDTLDITGTGIMGYIEIEKIGCSLPIYHGTDEGVLQIAIGHIEGSSLPVATTSSHIVLSGHRGLPSAKLFTDLDELVEGDEFVIRVLDETYTYEVDQIRIVLPNELNDLAIEEGKQYCTLVTCTPYGINTHRLLVRGHLVDDSVAAQSIRVTADAIQLEKTMVAPFVAVPLLILLLILWIIFSARRKRYRRLLARMDAEKNDPIEITEK